MIFGQDRDELRRMYVDSWQKHREGQVLSPLEAQIAQVIDDHPEYQPMMLDADGLQDNFSPEAGTTNPFLHMGLHLAIRDQVSTDRPSGVAAVFGRLSAKLGTAHDAEHAMLDALAETLWEAQRNGVPPDEHRYFERLQSLG